MKNNYDAVTLIYHKTEISKELEDNILNALYGMGVVIHTEKIDNTVCQIVQAKDDINNHIKFDTLVITNAKSGYDVYHILKHKSLFNSVEKIFVYYADDHEDQLEHRKWQKRPTTSELLNLYIRK